MTINLNDEYLKQDKIMKIKVYRKTKFFSSNSVKLKINY